MEKTARGFRIEPPARAFEPCPPDDLEGDYAEYVERLEQQIATHAVGAGPVDEEAPPAQNGDSRP